MRVKQVLARGVEAGSPAHCYSINMLRAGWRLRLPHLRDPEGQVLSGWDGLSLRAGQFDATAHVLPGYLSLAHRRVPFAEASTLPRPASKRGHRWGYWDKTPEKDSSFLMELGEMVESLRLRHPLCAQQASPGFHAQARRTTGVGNPPPAALSHHSPPAATCSSQLHCARGANSYLGPRIPTGTVIP